MYIAVYEEGDQLKITLCELLIVMVVMIMMVYKLKVQVNQYCEGVN